ncbi:MAG: aldo/keto reductase [Phycisphaerales bacterium JB059]
MQMRPLGESGIQASVVALGAWAMGGWMWGGADEEDAVRAVHAAIDHGVNMIDTAPIYGFGHSEIVVGRAIKDRRDHVLIATKCGMVPGTPGGRLAFRSTAKGAHDFGHIPVSIWNDPESIRWEVESSLQRLGTDRIDLYQTHWQEEQTPIAETMGCLLRLKEEGKIRAIGVCNATTEQMEAYRAVGRLDSDQEKYSMLDRGLEEGQLAYCRERQTAVLAYSPLALGLLTGKIGAEREFGEGDVRRGRPRFAPGNLRRVAELLGRFEPVREKHGCTVGQLVIAWTVRRPGLTHALVGARNAEQAIENAGAGRIRLSEEDLGLMDGAIAELGPSIK